MLDNYNMNQTFDKVYVINLDTDRDKLNKLLNRLHKIPLSCQRFPAIDGAKYLKNTPPHIIQQKVHPICANFCTPATIGIFLSHQTIWKKIVKNHIPRTLILEDDVYFVNNANQEFLRCWKQVPADWDIVYLGCLGACYPDTKDYNSYEYLYSFLGNIKNAGKRISENIFIPENPHGSHAYAVSLSGAKKLLKIFKQASFHIDILIAYSESDLNIYAIHPNIAYQKIENTESTTSEQRPYLLNTWLQNVYIDSKNMPASWRLSIPAGQILGYPINFWPLIFILGAILAKKLRLPVLLYLLLSIPFSDIGYVIWNNKPWINLVYALFEVMLMTLVYRYVG